MEDQDKRALRERVWRALEDGGAARFPGARGRIPNFVGAEQAARQLVADRAWQRARTIKCNPDAPQRPVRHAALEAGKTVIMAVPKLGSERPFIALDPGELGDKILWQASSIKGAGTYGRSLSLDEVPAIDLIITGCVGVGSDGARLGKGGGYSDLEYAVLREMGRVHARTPIATTVHDRQRLDRGAIPCRVHDISVDVIATPEARIRTKRRRKRPSGVVWELLDEKQLDAMPALGARAPAR